MNNIQLNEAYANWTASREYDLKLDLNTESELTFEQMSKLLCKYFYKKKIDFYSSFKIFLLIVVFIFIIFLIEKISFPSPENKFQIDVTNEIKKL